MHVKLIESREQAKDFLREVLPALHFPQKYRFEIKQHRTRRSLSQNSLYWLWLTAISEQTGMDKGDLHVYFKERHLPYRVIKIFGEEQAITMSTGDLNTKQFTDYLEKIRAEVSEYDVLLLDPSDREWESFYSYYQEKIS